MLRLRNDRCFGVDVSEANGPIHAPLIRDAGIRYLYAKANTGEGWRDRLFSEHIDKANDVGLLTGAYHFALPDNDPIDDVDALLTAVSGARLDLPAAVDFETLNGLKPEAASAWLDGWLVEYRARTAARVVLYFGKDFYAKVPHSPAQAQCIPWCAWYADSQDSDTWDQPVCDPWGKVGLRQALGNTIWSDGSWGPKPKNPKATIVAPPGRIPGIATECDVDVYFGSYDAFKMTMGLDVALPNGKE